MWQVEAKKATLRRTEGTRHTLPLLGPKRIIRPYFSPIHCSEARERRALDFPIDDTAELEAELARLKQEHRDLDTAIEALERMVAGDQLQIQRLKKRKLGLKDRIMRLEDQLTPDIIA
jgi:hypothetical protein